MPNSYKRFIANAELRNWDNETSEPIGEAKKVSFRYCPNSEPPEFEIEIDSPDGKTATTITVSRSDVELLLAA